MELTSLLNLKGTEIYINSAQLGGVIYFSMKSSRSTQTEYEYGNKGVYEILSAEPFEITESSESYLITLKQYTQDFNEFENNSFKLEFRNGDKSRVFEDCKILLVETYVDNDRKLVTVSTIRAERMR